MVHRSGALRALVGAIVVACFPAITSAAGVAAAGSGSVAASNDVQRLLAWIVRSKDNAGLPFVVVDKKAASIAVYSGLGQRIATSPVLLGADAGDRLLAGVDAGNPTRIPSLSRMTPAGRFASMPGKNLDMERVVWFDYGAGLAIHRLRGGRLEADRQRRVASPDAAGRHTSAGCVVVPAKFFVAMVQPALGLGKGVVYILPELESLSRFFPAIARTETDD
jgi:hypothetical protein